MKRAALSNTDGKNPTAKAGWGGDGDTIGKLFCRVVQSRSGAVCQQLLGDDESRGSDREECLANGLNLEKTTVLGTSETGFDSNRPNAVALL